MIKIKIFKLFLILIFLALTIQFSFAHEIAIKDFSWTYPNGTTTKFDDSDLITIKIDDNYFIIFPKIVLEEWAESHGLFYNDTAVNNFNMYLDGSLDNYKTDHNTSEYIDNDLYIGRNYQSTSYFEGVLDEFRIYDYALTAEQINNNFLLNYNKIISNETTRNEDYICSITPNDGEEDGTTKNSSTLTIRNYVPSPVPTLLSPEDGFTSGALPEFNWTESYDDVDYDDVYYIIQIDNNSDFSSIDYTNTLSTNKDTAVTLDSTKIDTYHWRVLATDNIGNSSWSENRTFTYASWNITFNVTGSQQDRPERNGVNISSCNYTGFNQAGDTTNPYGPYTFPPGDWKCTFELEFYYDKTQTFTADSDKIVSVIMPETGGATYEEHTWLEALYNCIILEDCSLWDILREINQTVGYIWQHIQPTDQSVLTLEVISEVVNSTHNITYDATVNVPIKQGYGLGDYLPIRIAYWFIDKDNSSKCFSQGNPPEGIELIEPYCQPLMVQTMGPMGGSVTFRVDLRPNLTIGAYNITRRIEIDPDDVWIPYGHEDIGQIEVTEDSLVDPTISVGSETYTSPDKEKETIIIRESSSGGGGGETIIKYYPVPTSEEDEKDKESSGEEVVNEKEDEEQDKAMPSLTKEEGLTSIAGAAVKDIPKPSPLVGSMIIIVIVVGGLTIYTFTSKKFKYKKVKKKTKILKVTTKQRIFLIILVFSFSIKFVNATYLAENSTWQFDLSATSWTSIAFGDVDSDGDLDLAHIGCDGLSSGVCNNYLAKIYINNGINLTENSTWQQNLTEVHYGSIAFGDIDNDGDLDLALSGCNNGGSSTSPCGGGGYNSFIYINNGSSFTENSTWKGDIISVWKSSIAFGDINLDGKLDLALSGGASSGVTAKIYINNGTSFVENSTWESDLIGVYGSSTTLVDIDNDGDLDLGLVGDNLGGEGYISRIYINNGSSLVINSTWYTNLLGVELAASSWGDFDNNGRMDFTLIGHTSSDEHRIYNNTGSTLVLLQRAGGTDQSLAGIFEGSQAFGDYDNDGDLDLITSGEEKYTTLYLYNSSPFTDYTDDPETGIINCAYGPSIVWGDIDNDNDLDVILIGVDNSDTTRKAKVYINNITTANTAPNAPTSFTSSYTNNQLTLTWNNGSDTETGTLGLYYNLKVGNTSGGHEIVSGVYGGGDDNGYFGNMMQRKSITLKNLNLEKNQTIYWAVQTIDTGLAKSSWSTEQNFTLPLDITNPTITLNAPIDVFNTSNPVITFNATVYDDTNLTNVSLYGNWSGSLALNETNSSGINDTDYIFTKNLSSYGDGTYSWLIGAMDETNNTVNSSLRTFRIDTTYPVINLTSPGNCSKWDSSQTVTFTYNVTDAAIANCSLIIDNETKQNDTSITVNTAQTFALTLSNAVYNWSINCTDYVGYQNNSETRQLTVSYTAPSNGGGGGGGSTGGGGGGRGVATTVSKGVSSSQLWASLEKGETTMSIKKAEIAFSEIKFDVVNTANNVEITVTKLDEKPEEVKALDNVYQYIEVEKKNIESKDINKADVIFKVEKSWLKEQEANEDDIVLNKYTTKWNELPTSKIKTDPTYIHYKATTTAFSYFAVTIKPKIEEEKEEIIEEEIVEEEEIIEEEIEEEEEKKSKAWIWLLISGLVVIGLVGYFYVMRKKKSEK